MAHFSNAEAINLKNPKQGVFNDDSVHNGNGTYTKTPAAPIMDDPEVPKFRLRVDSEHKAKEINLFSFAAPHMRSFHLSWFAFFLCFFSAYAAAPLLPYIREDLDLTQYQANIAGVVTTAGTVIVRALMGQVCDKFGPRYAFAFLLTATSIPVYCMAAVTGAAGFIAVRLAIGCALASFVPCQFWCSIMFSPNVVGMANALAGGWGNAGGGVTQIVMPYITKGLIKSPGHNPLIAWRYAFLVPASMQIFISILILIFGQDLPDGNYSHLEKKGKKQKAKLGREFLNVALNYRTWALAAVYAYSFGVELSLDNALAPYFEQNFNFSIEKAANLAAIFGLCNFFARPLGGVASDYFGYHFGMRGRLWVLFVVLAFGGMACAVMGTQNNSIGGTLVMLVLTACGLEATCGAVYGVAPFVSRRSVGLVCGLISAGGAIGGVLNQAIFFLTTPAHGAYTVTRQDALKWMGCAVCAVSVICITPIYFPMWGGMFFPAKKGVTEEDYYYAEYTAAERENGEHLASSKFCNESRSMRGIRRIRNEGKEAPVTAV